MALYATGKEARKMSKVKEKLLGKWEEKVSQLAIETGYEFDHIWRIWIDLLGDGGDPEEEWEIFEGITKEHDW